MIFINPNCSHRRRQASPVNRVLGDSSGSITRERSTKNYLEHSAIGVLGNRDDDSVRTAEVAVPIKSCWWTAEEGQVGRLLSDRLLYFNRRARPQEGERVLRKPPHYSESLILKASGEPWNTWRYFEWMPVKVVTAGPPGLPDLVKVVHASY